MVCTLQTHITATYTAQMFDPLFLPLHVLLNLINEVINEKKEIKCEACLLNMHVYVDGVLGPANIF